MKRIDFRIILGSLLILAGGLGFLQAFGIMQDASDVFWGFIFLIAGASFLYVFVTGQWWAVIPGLVLAGIGVLILLPEAMQDLGGAVFLGAIGLSFWVVYLSARQRWWAIIPGGIVSTLAIVSAVPERLAGIETGSIFFFGLALTFLLVAWLAGQTWGYWPAAGLGTFGMILLVTSQANLASYVGAATLILVGVFIVLRSLMARE